MPVLWLAKYQGLGNDFLIVLDGPAFDAALGRLEGAADPAATLVRSLCDRHRGLGADGVLVLRAPVASGQVAMELRNADGGRAETSGNGLRCFALALLDAGVVSGPEVAIETDAGLRRAVLRRRPGPGVADVSVEMGRVRVERCDPVAHVALPGSRAFPWPAWHVDVGNPHLVLLAPSLEGVAVARVGPGLEKRRPGGQNVEIASYDPGLAELSLAVWERGAGETLACGTGSVAAAAALFSAGISPAGVSVVNPGGNAQVSLSGDDPVAPLAQLAGPVCRVARIEVDPGELFSSSGGTGAS